MSESWRDGRNWHEEDDPKYHLKTDRRGRPKDRFEKLAEEPRPSVPDGLLKPLEMKTTRTMIGERLADLPVR